MTKLSSFEVKVGNKCVVIRNCSACKSRFWLSETRLVGPTFGIDPAFKPMIPASPDQLCTADKGRTSDGIIRRCQLSYAKKSDIVRVSLLTLLKLLRRRQSCSTAITDRAASVKMRKPYRFYSLNRPVGIFSDAIIRLRLNEQHCVKCTSPSYRDG